MSVDMVLDILDWCWQLIKKIMWYWLAFMFMIPWLVAGILFSITVVGAPYAKRLFQASIMMWKFDWEVIGSNKFRLDLGDDLLVNLIWIFTFGLPLAAIYLTTCILMFCSIIYYPFGIAFFRMIKFAFAPFGAYVE